MKAMVAFNGAPHSWRSHCGMLPECCDLNDRFDYMEITGFSGSTLLRLSCRTCREAYARSTESTDAGTTMAEEPFTFTTKAGTAERHGSREAPGTSYGTHVVHKLFAFRGIKGENILRTPFQQ